VPVSGTGPFVNHCPRKLPLDITLRTLRFPNYPLVTLCNRFRQHVLQFPVMFLWSCIFRYFIFFGPPFSTPAFSVHPSVKLCDPFTKPKPESKLVTQRILKLIHTATPDTTKLSCLCRVRFGGVNWIPDYSRLSPTENLKSEHVQSNRPIHTCTPDTTQTRPSCRVWCGGVN